MISKEIVEEMLDIVPDKARCCYTGQSALAYCPDPTFTFEEMDMWESETDVDIFCYTQTSHASVAQAFICAGWTSPSEIEEFKSDRIRFWDPNRKFNLQTLSLAKESHPKVNISWHKDSGDALDTVKRFDMDYLAVAMDMRTRIWADLRGKDHRVAHVNPYHARFDPVDTEPSFWYRQFDRCPKGWSRGIDTRPVAEQYCTWIKESLELGDRGKDSKTRFYQDRMMADAIRPLVELGMDEAMAKAVYHLVKGESNTWAAQAPKHKLMLERIEDWLKSVDGKEVGE